MGFSSDLQNDQAYVNGIGRFNITVSDNNDNVTWFQNGKAIADNVSMLKFERVVDGNKRALIVKNCTKSDFATYAAECAGQKKEAKLSQQSSFVQKISDVEGYKGDIAVFECRVTPGSIVAWSFKGKKINRADFRFVVITDCVVIKSNFCQGHGPHLNTFPLSFNKLALLNIQVQNIWTLPCSIY